MNICILLLKYSERFLKHSGMYIELEYFPNNLNYVILVFFSQLKLEPVNVVNYIILRITKQEILPQDNIFIKKGRKKSEFFEENI